VCREDYIYTTKDLAVDLASPLVAYKVRNEPTRSISTHEREPLPSSDAAHPHTHSLLHACTHAPPGVERWITQVVTAALKQESPVSALPPSLPPSLAALV